MADNPYGEGLGLRKDSTSAPQGKEHPALSRASLGSYAQSTAEFHSHKSKTARLEDERVTIALYNQTEFAPLAIPQGVGETLGYRLAELAGGVRVPRVALTTEEPSSADCLANYVKRVSGGWMLSERVPASIPLYYLATQVPTGLVVASDQPEDGFRQMFKSLFDKRCPLGREAYADFPSDPPTAVHEAARWDSEQRLAQYAYRSFLYCTYPHASNVLIDTAGSLWLIDHEKMCLPNEGDDIGRLWQMVADSPKAVAVCKRATQDITEKAIESCLSGIPDSFWRPREPNSRPYANYDNPQSATQYFVSRLDRWNTLFSRHVASQAKKGKRHVWVRPARV